MGCVVKRNVKIMGDIIRGFKGCTSILDLGCSRGGKLKKVCDALQIKGLGVDADPAIVEIARESSLMKVILGDIMKSDKLFADNSFDGVMITDVLEHFDTSDAIWLAKQAMRIAKKAVVATIPIETAPRQFPGKWQEHKSLWTTKTISQLWEGKALIFHDKSFHERLALKGGPERHAQIKRDHHQGRSFPEWTICYVRFDIPVEKLM